MQEGSAGRARARLSQTTRIVISAVTLGALAATTAACAGGGSSSTEESTLTIANAAGLGFDLADQQPGWFEQYLQPVYDSLFRISPDGDIGPNIATEWEYDDALTALTIDLRTDVEFTDGESLDAEAVKANIEHTRTGASTTASQLQVVEDVEVVDSDTVILHLTAPDPSLLPNLGMTAGMLASPAAIEAGGLKTTPVGSGPYTLDASATTEGSQYTFVRNPDYWNPDDYPYDRVVVKVLTDNNAILNALRTGQVDAGPLGSAKDAKTAEGAGLHVLNYPNGDLEAVYFYDKNGTIAPALADVRVRQAINYALDRDAIVKAGYGDLATPTAQMFAITEDDGIFDPALNDVYPYDPEKARVLLAEAGYPAGFDVVMPDWSGYAPEVNAAINQNLADIGIRITLDTLPVEQMYGNTLQGGYAMGWQPYEDNRPWDLIQFQIKPDAPWNPFHYEDPQVTALIGEIQATSGEEQTALFRELNEYLVEIAWAAPINATVFNYATSADVEATPQAFAKRPPLYNFRPAD
jgi:peptide/nickel transport system substrate-binding protein